MKSRTRKLLSILLAAAMVLSMNTLAFAAEADGGETALNSIEKDVKDAKRNDVTDLVIARAIPDNWSIYSDPKTWSTADYVVSVNNTADDNPYLLTTETSTAYKAYNPIYYYLDGGWDGDGKNPEYEHLVDGKQVEKLGDERVNTYADIMLHRVIDAGDGNYLLVGYKVGDKEYENYELVSNVFDNDGKNTGIETHRVNNYYNGQSNDGADSEMVVDYVPGKKFVRESLKKKKGKLVSGWNKKTEVAAITGKAILVKYDGTTVTPVSKVMDFGGSDLVVSPKNNDAASISKNSYYDTGDLYTKTTADGKTTYTFNGYKTVNAVLTPKTDNAFLKGQPHFTISVKNLKSSTGTKEDDSAVKKLKGAVNKALKSQKFNFEIARLSIGDASKDTIGSQFSYKSNVIEGTVSDGEIYDYYNYKGEDTEEAKKKVNTTFGNAAAAAEKEYAEMYWKLRSSLGDYIYNNRSEDYEEYTTEEQKKDFLDRAIVSDNYLNLGRKTSYTDKYKDGDITRTVTYYVNPYFTGNINISTYMLKNDVKVKAYFSAEADRLAASSDSFSCNTDVTRALLDTSNEKGKTLLTMDKKGKYKLNSLVFANPYKEVANSVYYDYIIKNVGKDQEINMDHLYDDDYYNNYYNYDKDVLLFNVKYTYNKVKVGTKAGGKTDIFYEQKEAEKAANTAEFTNSFIVLHGQNNFEDACTMRLKDLRTEYEWISVGNYKDENFYYVGSAD